MKFVKTTLAFAVLVTAITAGEATAASFNPGDNGGKKYSRSDARQAARSLASSAGGATLATDYYCAWQGADGGWKAKKVNMLTVCINSIKVACTDGQCAAE